MSRYTGRRRQMRRAARIILAAAVIGAVALLTVLDKGWGL